ncbi:MAG TPA: hypothetical protein V6C76_01460 [Drouetiella sp.]
MLRFSSQYRAAPYIVAIDPGSESLSVAIQVNNIMRSAIKLLLPLTVAFSAHAAYAADADWATYAAPTKDFEVDVPGPVDVKKAQMQGIAVRTYKATNNGRNFVVTATTVPSDPRAFDGFTKGIQESVGENSGTIKSSQKTSGSGWEGVLVDATQPGREFSYLALHPTDNVPLGYALMTNASPDDPATKKFFGSLKVHVAHTDGDETYGGLVDPKTASGAPTPYEQGLIVGKILGFCVPILIITLIVGFAIWQGVKKKKKPE